MEFSTRRRSFNLTQAFKHTAIVVEANPFYRAQLGELIITRQFMRVSYEESLEMALDLLVDKWEEVKWVIFDETAALSSSEERIARFLRENRQVTAKFVLFTDMTDPNWPGHHTHIVKKDDLDVLM